MAGKRLPTEVVEARGKKHLTKQEKQERKESEVRSDGSIKRLQAPKWLPENLRPEFNSLSKQIIELMPTMVCRSDGEQLAAYCMVHAQWLRATEQLNQNLRPVTPMDDASKEAIIQKLRSENAAKWAGVQGKLFSQARALAQDLGLTISSRCELVVPKAPEKAESNPFLQLIQGGAAVNG